MFQVQSEESGNNKVSLYKEGVKKKEIIKGFV